MTFLFIRYTVLRHAKGVIHDIYTWYPSHEIYTYYPMHEIYTWYIISVFLPLDLSEKETAMFFLKRWIFKSLPFNNLNCLSDRIKGSDKLIDKPLYRLEMHTVHPFRKQGTHIARLKGTLYGLFSLRGTCSFTLDTSCPPLPLGLKELFLPKSAHKCTLDLFMINRKRIVTTKGKMFPNDELQIHFHQTKNANKFCTPVLLICSKNIG